MFKLLPVTYKISRYTRAGHITERPYDIISPIALLLISDYRDHILLGMPRLRQRVDYTRKILSRVNFPNVEE